jgi:hypothetical protein
MTARGRWTLAIAALLVANVIAAIIVLGFAIGGGDRVLPEYAHPAETR